MNKTWVLLVRRWVLAQTRELFRPTVNFISKTLPYKRAACCTCCFVTPLGGRVWKQVMAPAAFANGQPRYNNDRFRGLLPKKRFFFPQRSCLVRPTNTIKSICESSSRSRPAVLDRLHLTAWSRRTTSRKREKTSDELHSYSTLNSRLAVASRSLARTHFDEFCDVQS